MGWAKSAGVGRRVVTYHASVAAAVSLRERPPGAGADFGAALSGVDAGKGPGEGQMAEPEQTSERIEVGDRSKRNRRALPVYDVATGEDLETPVNLDNTLLQVMFPDLRVALGQVPPRAGGVIAANGRGCGAAPP